jgi:hypothetical protein
MTDSVEQAIASLLNSAVANADLYSNKRGAYGVEVAHQFIKRWQKERNVAKTDLVYKSASIYCAALIIAAVAGSAIGWILNKRYEHELNASGWSNADSERFGYWMTKARLAGKELSATGGKMQTVSP